MGGITPLSFFRFCTINNTIEINEEEKLQFGKSVEMSDFLNPKIRILSNAQYDCRAYIVGFKDLSR